MASIPPFARRRGRFVPSTRPATSPASSRTFKCCEIAGCVILNGPANSITVASPLARRASMARLVGSAKAANAASSPSISIRLYKYLLIVKGLRCLASDSVRWDVPARRALISRELWILEEDAQVVMTFAGQEARKERHSGVDFSGGKEYRSE